MKKLYFVLAIAIFAFAFASCTKEGAYKPKERISKIFISSTYSRTYTPAVYEGYSGKTDKYLRQMWKWGDKTLDQIDNYESDGSLASTLHFSYDKKNRLERIDNYQSASYTTYKYDGNELKSAESWNHGAITSAANISYEGNVFTGKKIKKIEYTVYNKKKNAEGEVASLDNALVYLLGEDVASNIDQILSEKATRGVVVITIDLTWKKKNVEKMVVSGNDGGYFEYTYTYSYDSNKNPYYKMYAMMGADEESVICLSENNVTGYNYTYVEDGDTENGTESYNISYDGKFPSMRIYTYTSSYNSTYTDYSSYHYNEITGEYGYDEIPYTSNYTSTTTTYFEYE
jgi:hypothetical protein